MNSSGTELEFDDKRLSELNDVSKTARDARRQLSRTLRAAQDAGDELQSKYGLLRASMRKSKFLVRRNVINELSTIANLLQSPLSSKTRVFLGIAIMR